MEIEKIQLYTSKDGRMWYDVDLQGQFHPESGHHIIIELKDMLEMMKQLIDKLEKEQ